MSEHGGGGDSKARSRLPQEPAYWNGLANRITLSARSLLLARRERDTWWRPLSRLAAPLGLAAAAAVVVVLLFAPFSRTLDGDALPMTQVLAPDDPLAQVFVSAEQPPGLAVFMTGTPENR